MVQGTREGLRNCVVGSCSARKCTRYTTPGSLIRVFGKRNLFGGGVGGRDIQRMGVEEGQRRAPWCSGSDSRFSLSLFSPLLLFPGGHAIHIHADPWRPNQLKKNSYIPRKTGGGGGEAPGAERRARTEEMRDERKENGGAGYEKRRWSCCWEGGFSATKRLAHGTFLYILGVPI